MAYNGNGKRNGKKIGFTKRMAAKSILALSSAALHNDGLRRWVIRNMERKIYQDLIIGNPDNRPVKVQEDKYYMGRALLRSIDRAIGSGNVSKKASRGLLEVFLGNVFFGGFYKRMEFLEKYGYRPPVFMTISPTKMCNLQCIGCYAASSGKNKETLPWQVLDKVISQAKEFWGSNFFVISGGEPLLYKSEGKTILDLYEKHSDAYFLMYTNGTLITPERAKRFAELGNITPSISIEGMREETDYRRGKGVFDRILQAFQNLRTAGVPFGVSITATRWNINTIMSEEFYKFYFIEQGAVYGWIFQYMPIGRGFTLDLMPTPEERLKLFEWEWHLVREKGIFLADFWNSATSSDGCIAAARSGGYFYINWNGDVMPCVFVPYTVDNVVEAFKEGRDLNDIINSGFFKEIRDWQDSYGYRKPPHEHGNWMRPCFIRDHHKEFMEIVKRYKARPGDDDAKIALTDKDYHNGLVEYDRRMEELTDKIWQEHYIAPELERVKK